MEHESTIRQAKDQDRAEISEAHRSAFGAHEGPEIVELVFVLGHIADPLKH